MKLKTKPLAAIICAIMTLSLVGSVSNSANATPVQAGGCDNLHYTDGGDGNKLAVIGGTLVVDQGNTHWKFTVDSGSVLSGVKVTYPGGDNGVAGNPNDTNTEGTVPAGSFVASADGTVCTTTVTTTAPPDTAPPATEPPAVETPRATPVVSTANFTG